MPSSPQRILANDRNLVRTAALTASNVKPVENNVLTLPTALQGNARVSLSGTYTGSEEATYDVEIVDTTVDIPRVSAPTFSGAGSGTLSDITAAGASQVYTVELSNAGIPATVASVTVEGVIVQARTAGAAGNSIRITVDQSTLTFTPSDYSLLTDLTTGSGGTNAPLIGQGFDWDSKVMGADGTIPADAHRVAFGDDKSAVYLAYKQFANNQWEYHLVPALARDVPKGTRVQFVTGGRTVTVSDGASTETYTDVVTAFDLLNDLRTLSTLLVLDGVVTDDRTPTGQAARELALRTDAHAESSSGSGSKYATGFENVTVEPAAGTQLVTATCYAVTSADHPAARLGSERWALKSSLLGDLGTIVTGEPYAGAQFGLTIPTKLPPGYGAPKGRFGVSDITYASRTGAETEPPICPVALLLGPDAVDQTITLRYTARPTGDCDCSNLPVPDLNTSCLGNPSEGGDSMTYKAETIVRLKDLRAWAAGEFRNFSKIQSSTLTKGLQAPFLVDPRANVAGDVTEMSSTALSLRRLLDEYERTLARIDKEVGDFSSGSLGMAGAEVWDVAVAELKADMAAISASPATDVLIYNLPTDRYVERLKQALTYAGLSPLGGADASAIESGDGCWRDYGDSAWWEVVGSAKGAYAPAFSNQPYYSSRRSGDGVYFSTHEFAFQINVKCPENLKAGDTITMIISESSWGSAYQVGDELTLPIVAAAALYLAGGKDGAPTQTWNVNGTIDGPLPPFYFDPTLPTPYGVSGLGFTLNVGGVPFAKGDRFRFAVEGGHFRWRRNAGPWYEGSPSRAIPLDSAYLDDGLSVAFATGASTSFVVGDRYSFRALQPWAVSNLQRPTPPVWKWTGTAVTLDIAVAADSPIKMVALMHAIGDGATITLEGGAAPGVFTWSESLTWRAGCIWAALDRVATYLRLSVSGVDGGAIQWLWLGDPLTTALSADVDVRRSYRLTRATGLQLGRFTGKALSGSIAWSEGALDEADASGLSDMLDHVKEHDDEPIIVIPQVTRTADPVLFAQISADEVDLPDPAFYNTNSGIERRVSATLPLSGIWQ